MRRTQEFTVNEFMKLLEKNDYELARITGEHYHYKKKGEKFLISIPVARKTLNMMMTRRLIKEGNLKV